MKANKYKHVFLLLVTASISTVCYSGSDIKLLRGHIVAGGQKTSSTTNSGQVQLQNSFGINTLHTSSANQFSLQGGLWPANASDIIFNNSFE